MNGLIKVTPIPKIEFIEVDDLIDSERGIGGFGSSYPIAKSN